ncbi:ATP-binding cassette domain-containing protein [Lysinibacillus sp. NPDC093712]|uniref:ATP-binding cassette domain-containing protein n=1 Tax=Lysinibacillus sp. NPDC093712 TaxID=3390579 RepID=UPI003D03F0F3
MALLEFSAVGYSYSKLDKKKESSMRQTLQDVSFSLEQGHCLAMLGSSGAGKSTIGHIALGLRTPHSGTVRVEGIDLYNDNQAKKSKIRREIQAVFQDCYSSVNSKMTAGQIIGEPIDNFLSISHKEKQRMIEELLEQVGLSASDMNKFPWQFSGGQLQRICIARAISVKPKIIVLDESVSSLDVVNQVNIIRLLRQLKDQFGMSYLFITHNLKAAFALADQYIVLDKGKIHGIYSDRIQLQQSSDLVTQQLLKAALVGIPGQGVIRTDRTNITEMQRLELVYD